MIFIILLLIVNTSNASELELLSHNDRYVLEKPKTKTKVIQKHKPIKKKIDLVELELKKGNEILLKQLKEAEKLKSLPLKRETHKYIPMLTILKGVTNTAIIASNRDKESFIVTTSSNYFKDAKLRCFGKVNLKRVEALCDMLVTKHKQEIPIKVKITDLDGTRGLLPDHYHTSEEKDFATNALSTFLSGMLEASKSRSQTLIGAQSDINLKNSFKNGLSESVLSASKRMGDTKGPVKIAMIKPNKQILIHFLEGVKL